MSNFNGKFGNIRSEPIYNPFFITPDRQGGELIELTGGILPNEIYTSPEIIDVMPTNTTRTKTILQNVPLTVNENGEITHTPVADANDMLEKGKNFIKDNPLLSIGIALGLGFVLFGNKGK